MRAVVFAYHNMGITGLVAVRSARFDIAAVFSHRDDPGENRWFSSVVAWAEKQRIDVYCPDDTNQTEWVEKIKLLAPDVIFSFYYRHLLSEEILKIPPAGAYNLHGSLLPAYRGRCPVNWVLIHGEKQTGVTLHHMTVKADAGDIVAQRAVDIEFADTALTLFAKLSRNAAILLDETLPLILAGTAPRIPQDWARGSYFGERRPEDGRIDWHKPAADIYNLIRAVTVPYPGAFTSLPGGGNMIIWWASPEIEECVHPAPGTVGLENNHVFVKAGDGRLRLLDVELGGQRMTNNELTKFFQKHEGAVLK